MSKRQDLMIHNAGRKKRRYPDREQGESFFNYQVNYPVPRVLVDSLSLSVRLDAF